MLEIGKFLEFLGVSTKGKRGICRKTGEFTEKEQSFY